MSAVEHVADLIAERDPGCVVLRFVVVAEVIDQDGERGIWTETHEDALRWDTYGLLTEALQAEKAEQINRALGGDDDG